MNKNSILIVEDEAIIAYDLAERIKKLGYDVLGIIDTGEEAVHLAYLHRPALVLMDIQLAGVMDGIAAAERIYHECSLPVLFLTANDDLCREDGKHLAGAVGCIKKPFSKEDIRAQITKALAEKDENES